jgi:hypothetical protein
MAKPGRPPKKLEDCLPKNWRDIILDMSAEGLSDVEIRAQLCLAGGKFNYDTWYALKDREKEFAETLQIGKLLCQAWWEKQSRISLSDQNFQTGNWYANMKNRFGWRDKTDIEHSLSDSTVEKFATLSVTELLTKANAIIGKSKS